ncbi:MAG: helix-turn-helix domain-containing protein [Candidatus Acidiferrales bacterium]
MIKQRLEELDLEQKDLAVAAEVTDSYISQLLARKKLPPLPDRTDIYTKIEKFLKLPATKLSDLAAHERAEELKKKLPGSPVPLYKEVRVLVLRKCAPAREKEIRAIFERQPFGELERLVTQKLLNVVQKVARQELANETWLKLLAQLNGQSYKDARVNILDFLEADIFDVSAENCLSFLDPLIDSWDIDLANFGMEIVLNRRLSPVHLRKIEFVEKEVDAPSEEEPGLKRFLRDSTLSGDATEKEIEFLKQLKFKNARPTEIYYYRELQNLRDPLNFRAASVAPLHRYGDTEVIEREMQAYSRRGAIQRWANSRGKQSSKRAKPRSAARPPKPGGRRTGGGPN